MYATRAWLLLLCACLTLTACHGGRRGGRSRVPFDAGNGADGGGGGGDGSIGDAGPTCDLDCSHLDGDCVVGRCDGVTGECVAMPLGEGAACDDGDPCTDGDTCTGGTCVAGGPTDCSELSDDCNVGTCDAADGGCVAVPTSEGAFCDDGDPCTTGESCGSGTCGGGTPMDCSFLDSDCVVGECNPSTGSCGTVPVADSTLCDDGDACTTLDRCSSGVCTAGSPVDCSSMTDDCNVGMCDASTGGCYAAPITDGTFCDDGDSCTVGDSCTAGVCGGTNTCCGIDDFRLSEVWGDTPDYIEIVNTGTCTLDTAGLSLSWYLGCDTFTQTYAVPSRMVPPGGVLRIVDSSTSMSNEIYLGTNICHTYYEQGWVALCNGACSSTCSNYLDYLEMSGSSGTLPVSRPTCASFTPAPLAMGSATSSYSATRIAYTGSGTAARQSDWAMSPYSRTP